RPGYSQENPGVPRDDRIRSGRFRAGGAQALIHSDVATPVMPLQLLFDIDGLDLSQIICDQEEIRRHNPHRGDMEHLNGIVYAAPELNRIVGYKDVRNDEFWVKGHIPG